MSSNEQSLLSQRESIYYTGDLQDDVKSFFKSGLEVEDEYDIRERATAMQSAFGEDIELMTKLYEANVNCVNGLAQAIDLSMRMISDVETPSEATTSISPDLMAAPMAARNDGFRLAVNVKINEDAIYDAREEKGYAFPLSRAKAAATRLSRWVLKSLTAEFDDSDYLRDALVIAVQVVLFSPWTELEKRKPGIGTLPLPLKYLTNDTNWYMEDQKVKAILSNQKGEMDALLHAVKVFWHFEEKAES
ncbi:hypothetical protein NCC49_000451 [Naganishia albida]|nr:hypothetical protein NCC49_000451 [Naganishia albida]